MNIYLKNLNTVVFFRLSLGRWHFRSVEYTGRVAEANQNGVKTGNTGPGRIPVPPDNCQNLVKIEVDFEKLSLSDIDFCEKVFDILQSHWEGA